MLGNENEIFNDLCCAVKPTCICQGGPRKLNSIASTATLMWLIYALNKTLAKRLLELKECLRHLFALIESASKAHSRQAALLW